LLFLRVTIAAVIISAFAGVGIALGVWLGVLANSPEIPLHDIRPGSYASVIVCARTGEELARLHAGINRTNVTLDQIPYHVRNAFIAIEDERFYYHNGIDTRGIGRAIWMLVSSGGEVTQGASTITQQLIKNRLGRFDSDLTTKLQEQYLAVRFESQLAEEWFDGCTRSAKDYILEVYLNTINLGRTNHGVQAAAMFYYGVDVWDLTIAQAATIAAITQNPSRFPPDRNPEANWERAVLVLRNMHRLGFITDEEHEEALNSNVYDTIVRNDAGEIRATMSTFDCFTDALYLQVLSDLVEAFGITDFEAEQMLFHHGLRIYSTQNTDMQAIVDEVFLDDSFFPTIGFEIDVEYLLTVQNTITGRRDHLRRTATVRNMEEAEAFIQQVQNDLGGAEVIVDEHRIFTPQPQGAFVLMDHHNGHVLAIRGVRGEKVMSRGHCRATIATRSPGSQLKPLVFAAGFDIRVLAPAITVDDIPWAIHPQGGRRYQPGNWWGRNYRGFVTSRQAIHTSMNIASVKALWDVIGIETGFSYMLNFGFTTLEGETGGREWSDRIPALALGGLTRGVTLLELTAAYATIANEGMYNRPIFYTRIEDRYGNLLLENNQPPRQVLNRETAYLVTNSMQDTLRVQGATGHNFNFRDSNMRQNIPLAGKTGTSQATRDLGWTGYSPFFTAGVWLGYDMPTQLHSSAREFHPLIWRTIMERIHYGLEPRSFERPSGITSHSVCRDSGLQPTEYCRTDPRGSRVHSDIFASWGPPAGPCHIHHRFTICDFSGLLAGPDCHPYFVSTRVGIVRPEPVPDFAQNASIADRHVEFSRAVVDGEVCYNCEGYYHQDDPYSEYPYDQYPGENGDEYTGDEDDDDESTWPWNVPIPTPDPYMPEETPPPAPTMAPDDIVWPDDPLPEPTQPPYDPPQDIPPDETTIPDPHQGDHGDGY